MIDLDYVSEWVFLCCWESDPGSCMTEGHALPWSHTITSDSVHTPPAWYRESRKVLVLNRPFPSLLNSLLLSLPPPPPLPPPGHTSSIMYKLSCLCYRRFRTTEGPHGPDMGLWAVGNRACRPALLPDREGQSCTLEFCHPGPRVKLAGGEPASGRRKPCHHWASQGCLSVAVKPCLSSPVWLATASQCL